VDLKIIVADDHPMFRAAVSHVLADLLDGCGVVEVASQSALEAAIANHEGIDLVLLDLNMPGAMGLSSVALLRCVRPDLPLIVISSNDHPDVINRSKQFGAAGFVSKANSANSLRAAVEAVMAGETWFSDDLDPPSAKDVHLARQLAQLTPQQMRVLMLLAEGLLNKQIGYSLGVTENTIRNHVAAILSKLECRSRTQAAMLVRALGAERAHH